MSQSNVAPAPFARLAPALVSALAALWSSAAAVARPTVNLTPTADATLYQDTEGDIANGAGQSLYAGKTNQSSNFLRRTLIKFDLSSIPAGSTITAVNLKLRCSKVPTGAVGTYSFTLTKVSTTWGEGTSNASGDEGAGTTATTNSATWQHRFYSATTWTTAGGTTTGGVSATTSVTNTGNYNWTSAAMVTDVQNWLNSPATNNGWMLKGNETTAKSARQFDSRTHPTSANRPVLTVTYTAPATSGACCFSDGTCLVTTSATCSSMIGSYQGNGTDCSPNPCPQPTGACCFTNGTCTSVTDASCTGSGGTWNGAFTSCANTYCSVTLTPFQDALPIPNVLLPTSIGPDGIPNYDVYIREFNHSFHASLPANRVWGYASQYPGPTFEVQKGQPIRVTWHNDLRNSLNVLRNTHLFEINQCLHGPDITGRTPVTVTHLHGLKVAPESDGYPSLTFAPGQSSAQYFYPNDQEAATLWYHDHALGITRLNVYAGLAGFYFIRDPNEASLNLPSGQYEVPLVFQDRNINAAGALVYNPSASDEFFGDKIVINGKVWPFQNVNKGKYRYRCVNGSNTRTYTIALRMATGAPYGFTLIGTDGGLRETPLNLQSLTLMPGERADIIIDFAPLPATSSLTMVNLAPAPFPGGTDFLSNMMSFRVQNATGHTAAIPANLNTIAPLPQNQSVQAREFTLRLATVDTCNIDTWLIDDLMFDDITDFPRIDTIETWSIANASQISHPFHVHLVQFQALDRQDFTLNGSVVVPNGPLLPIPPEEQGWKDTIQCPPNQITRFIAKFEGFPGTFPMHCHILEHEDHEMMRQFTVLCDEPAILGQPVNVTVDQGDTADFPVNVTGDSLTYQWYRGATALTDGPTGWGSIISGAQTNLLKIINAQQQDEGSYFFETENPCGYSESEQATLTVTPPCPGDLNGDHIVNTADLTIFLGQFGSPVAIPGSGADFNADGFVNTADLTFFLGRFGQPCPT
ncbi:MAG: multicopper oxidase domain-containing protein [Planctomycetes bacterium]|nr:multicopper oxidase domain-containing protein [Planctomycetota bacterium]